MRAIERRGYHRMQDQLAVEITPVTRADIQSREADDLLGISSTVRVARDMYLLDLEARQIKSDLHDKDPVIAAYFSNLSKRMDLLAELLIAGDDAPQVPAMPAMNVSPAGLAYRSEDLVPEESFVAVKMSFSEPTLVAASYARVCYSRLLSEENAVQVGLQFMSSNDSLEQLLARRMTALQAVERRKRLRGS